MRTFIAIDLPDTARNAIEVLQSRLPVGRPVPAENLHLTLAFLGEHPLTLIRDLHDVLADIRLPAFDLHLSGLDTFGSRDPKVAFVGVKPNPDLDHLHRKIRSVLRGAGLVLDRERFRPHVTFARFAQPLSPFDLERLRSFLIAQARFGVSPFTVPDFALFESTLTRSGAIHDELARYPLATAEIF